MTVLPELEQQLVRAAGSCAANSDCLAVPPGPVPRRAPATVPSTQAASG